MKRLFTLIACISLLILSQCTSNQNDTVVTIKTSQGDMVAILYDETPKHKENFIKLAKEGFYNDLLFHRVMQGFMIQGGDPDSRNAAPGQELGMGNPGYTIPAEFNAKFYHDKGALSAARIPDDQNPNKESSGSQFYIVQGTVIQEASLKLDQSKIRSAFQKISENPTNQPLLDSLNQLFLLGDMNAYIAKLYSLGPRIEKLTGQNVYKDIEPEKLKAYTTIGGAPHLDGEYTVFGRVISGLEVIDKIAAIQVDERNRPLQDMRMTVTAEELPRKKITELYGYTYPNQ